MPLAAQAYNNEYYQTSTVTRTYHTYPAAAVRNRYVTSYKRPAYVYRRASNPRLVDFGFGGSHLVHLGVHKLFHANLL